MSSLVPFRSISPAPTFVPARPTSPLPSFINVEPPSRSSTPVAEPKESRTRGTVSHYERPKPLNDLQLLQYGPAHVMHQLNRIG
jgi:hypothetical protein